MTVLTRVTLNVQSDRPLPTDRVIAWVRQQTWDGISLHEPAAKIPGDRQAGETGWEYVQIVGVEVAPA